MEQGQPINEVFYAQSGESLKQSQSEYALMDTKKKWTPRLKWDKQFKLITFSYPYAIQKPQSRRFAIKIVYLDAKKKERPKTIYFGTKGKKEYIDDQNYHQRSKRRFRYLRGDDCFHPQFWRIHLLNNRTSIKDSFTQLVDKLGLDVNLVNT